MLYVSFSCVQPVPWNSLCVLRFYGPVNSMGSYRVGSVYLTTLLLGRLSPLRGNITNIVHILSSETDNCSTVISGGERMTSDNHSWSISMKKCCWSGGGSNLQPADHQSEVHPTESPRLAPWNHNQGQQPTSWTWWDVQSWDCNICLNWWQNHEECIMQQNYYMHQTFLILYQKFKLNTYSQPIMLKLLL